MDLIVRAAFAFVILTGGAVQCIAARRYAVRRRSQGRRSPYEMGRAAAGILAMAAAAAWVCWPGTASFADMKTAVPVRWTGIVLLGLGLGLWLWSQAALGCNWSGRVVLRHGHTITRHGPYRWVRHPMYTSFILIALGLAAASANWLVSALFGLHVALTVGRARKEERLLMWHFGQDYHDYAGRTGRFFPRLC